MCNQLLRALALIVAPFALPEPAKPAETTWPSFAEWLDGVRQEALSRGIRHEIFAESLGHIDVAFSAATGKYRICWTAGHSGMR